MECNVLDSHSQILFPLIRNGEKELIFLIVWSFRAKIYE